MSFVIRKVTHAFPVYNLQVHDFYSTWDEWNRVNTSSNFKNNLFRLFSNTNQHMYR